MTMLKTLPEKVLNLWNNWEIRGIVLLSLLLQTILIIFGSRRKITGRIWIRILVWSAYLSADTVATFALGYLARSQGDLSGDVLEKANNSIQAFWAPFLLLHLGGPDTITAYSIEDNELWLRHLLGLVVQVGVAFYVFSRSWGSGVLSFIAIPLFIVGIVKYAERTWVLWSSCSKSLKKSSLSDIWRFPDIWRFYRRMSRNPAQDVQESCLLQAHVFSYISKFMMQDLAPDIHSLISSRELIFKNKADDAFKVVEVELGLIYDMLYTKAPLIYSRAGIILRCISFLLSVTAFISFQVKIDKHDYSTTDIAITYLLFAAAVFLEFYAFLCVVFSDWTMIWLIYGGTALTSAIYYQLRKLTTSERWSRSISQYNLISFSIKSEPPRCLELLGIDEMMKQMHVNRKDFNVGLQGLIFEHLRKKAEKIKEDLNVCDKNVRSKIIGQRGDGVLEREELLRDFKWCTIEVEFSRSILVWHLATYICYRADKGASSENETSRCLSEYMMYLLVIRPNMLSKGFGDEGYLHTLRELRGLEDKEEYLHTLQGFRVLKKHGPDDEEYQITLREYLRNTETSFQRLWKTEKSVVDGGKRLAKLLLLLEPEKRWEMINEVWVEMLAYAAAHCPWKEHTHQLRRGGELLAHVSLLMLHLGLTEQYEHNESDESYFYLAVEMFQEEREEYSQARRKYLSGVAGSSPDEYLKTLEKILEEKVQELEHKNQELEHQQQVLEHKDRELEQLRSFLTASAPQQGIDSLPRSLPAQTDDQGIN